MAIVTIIGAGMMGSALAFPARENGNEVRLVGTHLDREIIDVSLSEDWVGYSTRYGDSVGDFSPLSRLTVAEVKAIGRELGLPADLVDKVPIDGLCGKTDEDNLGFTYATLDRYIREGICEDAAVKERIDTLHRRNLFKLELMPCFEP